MLQRILQELKSAQGSMTLNDLSRKLGVEQSALESMIAYLVQKGRLQDDDEALAKVMTVCISGSCGSSCPGPMGCPFVMDMPRTFSLVPEGGD